MTNVALIFPGQGAQKVGMGKEFYDSSQEAKVIFEGLTSLDAGNDYHLRALSAIAVEQKQHRKAHRLLCAAQKRFPLAN